MGGWGWGWGWGWGGGDGGDGGGVAVAYCAYCCFVSVLVCLFSVIHILTYHKH